MKLLTKQIEKELEKKPFGSTDGQGDNAKVIVKFFNPYGAGTWLITEAEKQEDGSWLFYGLCELGYTWEWGYLNFSEIEQYNKTHYLGIERELYSSGKTVGELRR